MGNPPVAGHRPGAAPAETPVALRLAVGLLAAQTLGLAALVVFLGYAGLTARSGTPAGAVAVTLFAAVMTALMAALGWALWRRRGWARGPAIVLELLLAPIGYYLATGGVAWLGLPALAAGLIGAGALLAPATRAALGID